MRHKYFACYLSNYKNINLKLVIHESNIKLNKNVLYKQNKIVKKHIDLRNKNETIFFKEFVKKNKNYKYINIKNRKINEHENIDLVRKEKFDYIISYGCSIISSVFINHFKNRFINIHLGLSPYYKGAGTNFFPFANKELQFCGSTIMKISKKIDGGRIIHQIRPKFNYNDNIHTVGNKIIKKTAADLCELLTKKKIIKSYNIKTNYKTKTYKKKDFNKNTLVSALNNLKNGLIKDYILKKEKVMKDKFPIKSQL